MLYTKEQLRENLTPMLETLTHPATGDRQINALTNAIIKMFQEDRRATIACLEEVMTKILEDDGGT